MLLPGAGCSPQEPASAAAAAHSPLTARHAPPDERRRLAQAMIGRTLAALAAVHGAAARSGDGVVIFGGGVPCLSFAPVFGDSVRVVMT